MHLSDISMDKIQCSEVFASYSVCPLTADTSWVPFSTLFTSIYIPFTWIKSRHCVFTQSITCSLLTFDTNLTFLSIKCRAAGRDGVGPERLREFSANDAFGRLLRSIIPNDDWHRCNKSRIFKDFISKSGAACSVFRKCVSSVNNNSNFQPLQTSPLFQSGAD